MSNQIVTMVFGNVNAATLYIYIMMVPSLGVAFGAILGMVRR